MLGDAGFDVREVPFTYSAAPGLWGMPAAGVWSAVVLASVARVGSRGHAMPALVLLVIAAAALAIVAPRVLGGVAWLPLARRRAVNLVAMRGTEWPRVWLVAHVDSKSQPMPMVARVAGVGASLVAWALAFALVVAQVLGAPVTALWTPLGALGVIAALPVIGSVIGSASPGALDNASGVATVLLAATAELPDAPPAPHSLGVLVTSAEELGLAGARVWGREVAADACRTSAIALNVDSVDDVGRLRVMTATTLPATLERALDAERAVRRGPLPPGILVDAIALGAAGFAALTVSKATVSSLARIHSSRDTIDQLRGDGVMEAAALVRRLATSVAALAPNA